MSALLRVKTLGHARPTTRQMLAGGLVLLIGGTTFAGYVSEPKMQSEFTTGTFGVTLDGNSGDPVAYAVPFSTTDLQPGDSSDATVQVANSGTVDAYVTLASTTVTGGAEFGAALMGKVTASLVDVATGPLSTLSTTGDEWLIPAGGTLPVTVTVTLPEGTGNDVQGQTVVTVFNFSATSIAPPPVAPTGVELYYLPGDHTFALGSAWDGTEQTMAYGAYNGRVTLAAGEIMLAPLDHATDFYYGYGAGETATESPYRVVLDGSQMLLPGLRELTEISTPAAPIYAWTPPAAGTWTVTYAIETRNTAGGVVDSLAVTNTTVVTG